MCAYNPIKQDVLSETVDDQCIGLENNTSCSLQSETVDGVNTYTNYQPTSLVPLPQCKTFTGFQSHQVCHDWWEKDRVYQCKKAQSFDFSDLKRRTDVIAGSVTGDLNTGMTYKDAPRDANGNIISTSRLRGPLPSQQDRQLCVRTGMQNPQGQAGHTGFTLRNRQHVPEQHTVI